MSDIMNIAADRDRRQRNGATRGRDLYWGFTIAIFSNLVTLFIISQGGDLPSLAISVMVLATFIFVMINSPAPELAKQCPGLCRHDRKG